MIRINTFLLIFCFSIIITISGCVTVREPVPTGYLTTLTKGDHVTIHEKSGRVLDLIVTEVIVTIRPGLKYDLSGLYASDIKGGISRLFADRSPLITIEQNGNNIIGISDYYEDNEIIGTRKGDTIKFKFRAVYGPVTGVWQVNSDGSKLEGTWDLSGTTTGGTWNLNRIYYTSELSDIAASLIKGKLVSDRTPVEVMLGDINSIDIVAIRPHPGGGFEHDIGVTVEGLLFIDLFL